ncbi:MAG TPA: hypothetical protein VFE58_11390 [Tepidisphaeraceae bacterium]|jgi:TolB-like protein|nr:hypothetical protein [Tepidisphaeraceae bacterium]
MRFATWFTAVLVMGSSGWLMGQQRAATRPAQGVVVEGGKRVLVLPFESVSGAPGSFDWIGRGLRENLVSDLGRMKVLTLVQGDEAAVENAKAVEAGKAAGADVVVKGSFQVVDQDLRINGEIVDVGSGKVVGTLKSTGTVRDLFEMEDVIATQTRRVLVPVVYRPADLPLAIPAPVVQQPPVPAIAPAPVSTYETNYNRYAYYPSNYGYGYGGYYGGYWPGVVTGYSVRAPIGIGVNGSLVASGMIMVGGGASLPHGQSR